MSYTLITHFDKCSYRKLYAALGDVDMNGLCRIPYGKVADNLRFELDTLPFHFTISSSKDTLSNITKVMENFTFSPFEVVVNGIGVMGGKEKGYVLYFKIAKNENMDNIRKYAYTFLGNPSYLPERHLNHMTINISRDRQQTAILKQALSIVKPFTMTINSLGLYKIWPGELKSIYELV